MEVTSQLHAPEVLFPVKETNVPPLIAGWLVPKVSVVAAGKKTSLSSGIEAR